MVQVRVAGLAVGAGAPVILLKSIFEEPGVGRILPIWIGSQEATSIFVAVEGAETPRPLSHDLMKTLLEVVGAEVERVEVTKIEDGTFYAEITLRTREGRRIIDSRPSDAIALAARVDAPIWVADQVFDEAGIPDETGQESREEEKLAEFKQFLDQVNPEDFQG
ncbi:bifunctional nuclease family protein [Naasia sp. SYSU D00948]|uniref:bifunctional nuclease family protein n=1 Tax=Naasia sp. SYSU D00948 TaxID=2817379 RepID=UPI001B30B174|nr:bifunctional nuclease family protein [Naasia sp. SYSU D00948]